MSLARSLHGALFDAVERVPDAVAVSEDGLACTYHELGDRTRRVASLLARAGLRPGERVVVSLPNSVDLLATHFGILVAGGVSVPCEYRLSNDLLDKILTDTGAKVLVVSDEVAERYAPAEDVVAFVRGRPTPGYEDFALAISAERPFDRLSLREGGDRAVILYTTGTTGKPKGVVLNHDQTLFTIGNLIRFFRYGPTDREVVVLPLAHSFGLGHVYCNLFSGGHVHLERGLVNMRRVLNALESLKATGFPGTPAGFGLLLDRAPDRLASAGSHLRFVVVNSAALPPERAGALQRVLPHTDICVYYGLTEASRTTVLSLTSVGPKHYASVGRPMQGVKIRLAADTSEVLVRGPHIFREYWNDPVGTAGAFSDGWFRSGDIGEIDEDGLLYLKGRLNDLINVDGYKVAPAEVDTVLRASGLVEDGAAFGWFDRTRATTIVAAAVVPLRGLDVDEAALAEFCARRLAHYQVPSRWFRVEQLPRTDSGKLRRVDLAKSFASVDGMGNAQTPH